MSGMDKTDKTDKRDGAMRIFEALSGVDEKYLAACEQPQVTSFERLARFHRRYGKFVAAALVFLVVGAGYWGMNSLRLGNSPASNVNGSRSDFAKTANDNYAAIREEAAVAPEGVPVGESAPEEAYAEGESFVTEAGTELAAEQTENTLADSLDEAQDIVGNGYTQDKTAGTNSDNAANSVGSFTQEDRRDQGTATAEAVRKENLQAYLPKIWPQDCMVEMVEESSEAGVLLAHGSYPGSKKEFFLRIAAADEWQKEKQEGADYDADSLTLADVERELAGGKGTFTVRYQEDGSEVRLQFSGDGEAKEIWEMFASIQD